MKQTRTLSRRLRAAWRDTALLLRDFRVPLFLFALIVIGGGWAYFYLAAQANEPIASLGEALYLALTMIFFQASEEFPKAWYLQLFYFAMPVLGLGVLAQGLTEFGVLLFNRKSRSKEWEMAIASTFNHHIVVVGLGHLGYRVVWQLHELNQEVVVIEAKPRDDLVANLRAFDLPILEGDATREALLDAAGIKRARVLVLCTQNDNLNMQIAVKARSLNKDIRVIMRIFDDDFARALQQQFGFTALSATGMAAPVFAATAAGMDISHPITVEGQALSLARMDVAPQSKLIGLSMNQIEQQYDVSVVLHHNAHGRDFHPAGDKKIAAQDVIAVLGGHAQINRLAQDNR
ncbi:MAG: NAD-binding protein [Anaerolineales bacterium]|nr:NAD-binding protein [Anaerolineales bacterium]